MRKRISAGHEGSREKMKKIAPTKNEKKTLKTKMERFDEGEGKRRERSGRASLMNIGREASYDGRIFLRPMIVRDPYKYVNEVYYSNVCRCASFEDRRTGREGAVTCTHAHQHLHELVIIPTSG